MEGLALGAEAAGPGAPGEAGGAGAGGAAGAGEGGAEGERGAGRGPGLLETDRWLALLMRARCKKVGVGDPMWVKVVRWAGEGGMERCCWQGGMKGVAGRMHGKRWSRRVAVV